MIRPVKQRGLHQMKLCRFAAVRPKIITLISVIKRFLVECMVNFSDKFYFSISFKFKFHKNATEIGAAKKRCANSYENPRTHIGYLVAAIKSELKFVDELGTQVHIFGDKSFDLLVELLDFLQVFVLNCAFVLRKYR